MCSMRNIKQIKPHVSPIKNVSLKWFFFRTFIYKYLARPVHYLENVLFKVKIYIYDVYKIRNVISYNPKMILSDNKHFKFMYTKIVACHVCSL